MSIIHEETLYHIGETEVMVSERTRGESIDEWEIVHLRTDSMGRMTPDGLCELGRWLVEQGERIKRQYTKTGKPKKGTP